MDLQSAKYELRSPPGVGMGLLVAQGVVMVGLMIGVVHLLT
jgi:hypothetical protein